MTWELMRRIAVTLGVLLVYRLGSHIPLPGIDMSVWTQIFRTQAGGVLGSLNVVLGGGLQRMAIFSLNIVPLVTAAILVQLASIVSRRLRALQRAGERGRRVIDQLTRCLTMLLAAFQAYGVATGLQGVTGVVADPGWLFVISTVLTLAGGTLLLAWLCEQITVRGIGNGIALVLLVGIVTQLPSAVAGTLELGRMGRLSTNLIVGLAVIAVALTALMVLMEGARRRLMIAYAARRVGERELESAFTHLPLKLNSAGVVPVVIASWLLLLLLAVPITVVNLGGWPAPEWLATLVAELRHGRPLYLILYTAFIVLGTFFYTAFVLDPDETAANLQKHGGAIAGIAPGEASAEHVDFVLSRITVIGALYLAVVCLIPELLIAAAGVPFYFGGTSLLIVVCTILDVDAHARGYMRLAPSPDDAR